MKKTISIEGMSCQHCAKRVQTALAAIPGVRAATVDLGKKTAEVEGDALSDATLRAAVADAGYEATGIA
jgi:copper ion binding protein